LVKLLLIDPLITLKVASFGVVSLVQLVGELGFSKIILLPGGIKSGIKRQFKSESEVSIAIG
jgi:hypothetical protein